jgi:hypothetical protein
LVGSAKLEDIAEDIVTEEIEQNDVDRASSSLAAGFSLFAICHLPLADVE